MQSLYEKKLTTYPRSNCEYLSEKAWNDEKISAHHAIIPTRIKADFEKLPEPEHVGKGRRVMEQGWKAVVRQDEGAEEESAIPAVKYVFGEVLEKTTKPPIRFTAATLLQAMKEIYKYVRNDELKIELKECAGIGTEATRAGIIEKLQAMGFLKLAGKYFEPTEKARTAAKILPEEMTYPDTTAYGKNRLKRSPAAERDSRNFTRFS